MTMTATRSSIAVDGDTSFVSVFVAEEGGHAVRDGTLVTFIASTGGLCVSDSQSVRVSDESCTRLSGAQVLPPIVNAPTDGGIASVLFRSGTAAGPATVSARSGKATATTTITISGLVAPDDGSLKVVATPAHVAPGGASTITALVLRSDGSAVLDGTRVRFTTTAGSLSRQITLTQAGYAQTTLTAPAQPGNVIVRAVSGMVKDSSIVEVQIGG